MGKRYLGGASIAGRVAQYLGEGKSDAEITKAIKQEFPRSKFERRSLPPYKSKFRRGMLPGQRKLPRGKLYRIKQKFDKTLPPRRVASCPHCGHEVRPSIFER